MTTSGAAPAVGSPPTLRDAERAAEVLLGEGATKVLLFGSVARGEATAHSDMDLLAVMDDMGDYSQREDVWFKMNDALETAGTAYPYDVLVTDRPELKHLISEVATSFYASAATSGKVLVDIGPQRHINWEKGLVVPKTKLEQAEMTMKGAITRMNQLEKFILPVHNPKDKEIRAWESGRIAKYKRLRLERIAELLGDAHICFELSLKSLIHLESDRMPRKNHKTENLVKSLPDKVRRDIAEIMGSLPHDDIQFRHMSKNYLDAELPQGVRSPSDEVALEVTQVVCDTLTYAANLLEAHGGDTELVEEARQGSRDAAELITSQGVGEDLSEVPPPRPQPEEAETPRRRFWARLFRRRPEQEPSAAGTGQDDLHIEHLSSPQTSVCDRWMPNAKARCVLRRGHRGNCRSK